LAVGFGLALLLAVLAAGNGMARSAGFAAGLVFDNITPPADVGWRWLPDQHLQSPHGFPLDINAQGLRETKDIVSPKPKGVFRILCVGDSFTFGVENALGLTFPKVLEAILAGRPGAPTIEVLNAGVSGLNSCQEAAWLEHYGWELEPDLVIVGFVMNDVIPADDASMPRNFPGRSWMLRYPLYHWLRHNMINRWRVSGDDPEARRLREARKRHLGLLKTSPSSKGMKAFWDDALACLAGLGEACRAREVPALLIVFPTLPQMLEPMPLPEPQQLLSGAARQGGFLYVDLLPRYAELGEGALLKSDKAHPSRLGHRIAAEELTRALDRAGVLPR
jgi:lysophospholipase L1-like esterase